MLLEWTIAADLSSEAGLRQAIGHDAAPVAIDEFDKFQHQQQVLELFRTAIRGGAILRGTRDQISRERGRRDGDASRLVELFQQQIDPCEYTASLLLGLL